MGMLEVLVLMVEVSEAPELFIEAAVLKGDLFFFSQQYDKHLENPSRKDLQNLMHRLWSKVFTCFGRFDKLFNYPN